MKPIHKLNGGNGATLCNVCYGMISTGWIEDLICSQCKGYDDLGKFSKKQIKQMVLDEHKKEAERFLNEIIEKQSHKNNSNLNN